MSSYWLALTLVAIFISPAYCAFNGTCAPAGSFGNLTFCDVWLLSLHNLLYQIFLTPLNCYFFRPLIIPYIWLLANQSMLWIVWHSRYPPFFSSFLKQIIFISNFYGIFIDSCHLVVVVFFFSGRCFSQRSMALVAARQKLEL